MIKVIGGFMIQALNLYCQSDLFFVFLNELVNLNLKSLSKNFDF
ncbi:hypothetical protein EW15_2000 [Prochlorococcus sp. MIT 0801]|nr:hypothetical protein EW15_2000 [Prochlorococcus sp. MIT 0801]